MTASWKLQLAIAINDFDWTNMVLLLADKFLKSYPKVGRGDSYTWKVLLRGKSIGFRAHSFVVHLC